MQPNKRKFEQNSDHSNNMEPPKKKIKLNNIKIVLKQNEIKTILNDNQKDIAMKKENENDNNNNNNNNNNAMHHNFKIYHCVPIYYQRYYECGEKRFDINIFKQLLIEICCYSDIWRSKELRKRPNKPNRRYFILEKNKKLPLFRLVLLKNHHSAWKLFQSCFTTNEEQKLKSIKLKKNKILNFKDDTYYVKDGMQYKLYVLMNLIKTFTSIPSDNSSDIIFPWVKPLKNDIHGFREKKKIEVIDLTNDDYLKKIKLMKPIELKIKIEKTKI